jgi:hypothetical protein
MATKRYDPQCELLARYFLSYPQREGEVIELAGVIQEAIENWELHRPKDQGAVFKLDEEDENESDNDEHQY